MVSVMRQDSYWYLEGEGEKAVMKAMCAMCAKKARTGWFWAGQQGYGDYDLFCNVCENAIYIRGNDGPEAGGEDKQ